MKQIALVFCLFFGISSHAEELTRWRSTDVVGYRLTLVSKTTVQSFLLTSDGDALCGFGIVGGAVTAPALRWWIDAEGVFNVGEKKKTWVALKKINVSGSLIDVEEKERKVRYRRESVEPIPDQPVIKP